MKKKNLKLLADHLMSLPADYKHFDMSSFVDKTPIKCNTCIPTEVYEELKLGNWCDTVACAAGHLPFIKGIPKPTDGEEWGEYVYRVTSLGIKPDDDFWGVTKAEEAWDWCFEGEWASVDNTHHGAAKRIYWLLEHGLPDNWTKQLSGDAPLCYMEDNHEQK